MFIYSLPIFLGMLQEYGLGVVFLILLLMIVTPYNPFYDLILRSSLF